MGSATGSQQKKFLPQAVAEISWRPNVILIESDLYSRQGKAVTNFKQVLPPPESDLANQNLYLSAVDHQLRHADDQLSIGLILCRTRNKVVTEYALRNVGTPMEIARYTAGFVEALLGPSFH